MKLFGLQASSDGARRLADELGLGLAAHEERDFEDGEFNAELTGDTVKAMAAAWVSEFKKAGAENYFEMNLHDRSEPYQRYTVTVQKVGKLSPGEKASRARYDALVEAATIAEEQVSREEYGHAKHAAVTIANKIRELIATEAA